MLVELVHLSGKGMVDMLCLQHLALHDSTRIADVGRVVTICSTSYQSSRSFLDTFALDVESPLR